MHIETCHKIQSYFLSMRTDILSILFQIEWSVSVFIFFRYQICREQGDLSPTICDRGTYDISTNVYILHLVGETPNPTSFQLFFII